MFGGLLGYNNGKVLGSDKGFNLGSSNVEFLGGILGYVNGIIIDLDVETDTGSLDSFFDLSNYGKLEGLLLGGSLGSCDSKVIGSDEVIKLVISDDEELGTILGNVDGTTLGIDLEHI